MKKYFIILIAFSIVILSLNCTEVKKTEEQKFEASESDISESKKEIKIKNFFAIQTNIDKEKISIELRDCLGETITITNERQKKRFSEPYMFPKDYLYANIIFDNLYETDFFRTESGYLYTILNRQINPQELNITCPKGAVFSPSQKYCILETPLL